METVKEKTGRLLALVSLIVIVGLLVFFMWNTTHKEKAEDSTTVSIYAMDTYMTITLYGEHAEEAAEAAKKEIARLDALLSTGSAESEVSRLNREGGGLVSEDVGKLIKEALVVHEKTYGAFDISVYPVMKAWGFAGGDYRVPSDDELDKLLEKVDASLIGYSEETKEISLPGGMEIDFGGIAKGYTGDLLIELVKDYGIEHALFNLGGNVQALGGKTSNSDWKVAVAKPGEENGYLGYMDLNNKTMITSGSYERFFEADGEIYHHIIDPKTGKPADNDLLSVTIVTESGTLADALSTSLFVMGADDAITFWKEHYGEFDMILYTKDGNLFVTDGISNKFTSDIKITTLDKTY